MSSDGNTNRPLPSLILLGIFDFVCVLTAADLYKDRKFVTGTLWLVAGLAFSMIGYYWTQIKRAWNRLIASVLSRLALSDDSEIGRLKSEIEQLKTAQSKQPTYPIPTLRLKVLEMCSELQGFMSAHGHEPDKPHRELPETNEDFLRRYHQWQQDKITWGTKFAGDFRLQLLDRISHLRDEILAKAHIDDFDLSTSIETAANDSTGNADAVERIITRFWELALKINV